MIDTSIFIRELCYWWSKLKLAREVQWLLAFWKAQVAGKNFPFRFTFPFSFASPNLLYCQFFECYSLVYSGKTALAATVGIDSDFPYVKIVSSFPIMYINFHSHLILYIFVLNTFEFPLI